MNTKYKYKLSIIIPCYNCSKTIKRLMDSIVYNDLKKNEYQIIVVDDKSTDNFLEIVHTYDDKANITYCETTRDVHCPGNTRQAGMAYIEGEWFTFIDNDDIFKPNIFKKVFKVIEDNHIEYVLSTLLEKVCVDGYIELLGGKNSGWLHGNFYNTNTMINQFHITFKDDMLAQEDLYFNSVARATLLKRNKDYFYVDFSTYQWIENLESLSHTQYYHKGWTYTDEYMKDYIIANTEPYFEMYDENNMEQFPKENFINVILSSFLFTYFYYQGSIYKVGTNIAYKNIIHIHEFKKRIKEVLHMSEYDIINYIYSRPEMYNRLRKGSLSSNGNYIELQSFRDFVLNL